MFGSSSAFAQSSPFGSQSVFGQNNNPSSNPFAPKPFGSTSPFGLQTGSSIFGNTSTGVFGATQSPSPFSSSPAFGASSTPAFGASSTPAFGASSTPAFGSSSSALGGSSLFGQKPASPFGGFGSTSQSSPFGSTFQQSQPAFGSSLFGSSSPFGASSQPSFGGTSTPAFGSSSTPTFGSTSSPGFGAASTPPFGSTAATAFGNAGTAFGASSAPAFGGTNTSAFGASSAPAFGVSSTPAFGTSSSPAFGASSTPAFGTSSTPAFGASSSPSFNFGSTSAFGQSSSAFGSSIPFGSTASPFGAQSSAFGAQSTTPTFGGSGFGQSAFGGHQGGSRAVRYAPTPDADGSSGTQAAGKLESISAMPAYKDKSHEELRWEDFQRGDKGGPSPASQPSAGIGIGVSAPQSSPFTASSPFGQTSSNPFSTPAASNPFASKPSPFGSQGFGTPSSTNAFGSSPFGGSSTSNPFGSTSAASSSLFGQSTAPAFASSSSTSIFGQSSSSPFGSTPSLFGSSSAPGSTPSFASGLSFGNTQTPSLFPTTTPSLGQTGSAFGQPASSFGQTSSPFGSSNLFNSSSGFGSNLFSSSASPLTSSNMPGFSQSAPSLFQAAQPVQSSSTFSFSNFGQTQPAVASGFGGGSNMFGQSFGQPPANQSSVVVQPVAVTNPFGTLPAIPKISIGHAGTSPSIQYGISNMPVVDKASPVRISSLLTSRHLSQRRIKLPARKYHPKRDSLKVPFFSDDEEAPNTPKADALLIPRENPRALVIRPMDQWPNKGNLDKSSPLKDGSSTVHQNGKMSEDGNHFSNVSNGRMSANKESTGVNGSVKEQTYFEKAHGGHDNNASQRGDSYITLTGHRAGEAAIVYEHGADIEAMMPKLWHSDYYTEPRIQELAAKERAEPGYCRHVKDFIVGRHGYGSIKFLGETDVRRLDLESLIQFNNREVIVYMDDSKKPPVGQGLNKPAEVTLLNIKCYDKKTGKQYTEGPKIERYMEMLRRKAEDQGAEYLSYDPVKGEWKFKVGHFSRYDFGDDEVDREDVDSGADAHC